jgi:hypothetical protein
MDRILKLEDHEREELFSEAAAKMNVHPAIVEKDFWVVLLVPNVLVGNAYCNTNNKYDHAFLSGILLLQKMQQFKKATYNG